MTRLLALARHRAVLIVLASLMGVWGGRELFLAGMTPPDSSVWGRANADVVMFRRGLSETPRLGDTLRWFTGNWIGCNPFWRPASSYGVWVMARTLGWEHHDRYEIVTAVSYVAACVLLLLFALELTGRPWPALATVALYTIGRVWPLNRWLDSPGVAGIGSWVYIPDIWLALCVLPALMLAWRGRLWWAVALALLAAMVKETGFVALVLVPLFYWWRWRRMHRAFWVLAGVGAAMAAVKLVFVGPGWVLGSNLSLWRRMLMFVAPEPVVAVITGYLPWVIIGAGVAITVILRRNRPARLLAIPLSLVAAIVAFHLLNRPEPSILGGVAMVAVLDSTIIYRLSLGVALWIILAWAGLRGADRSLIVLLAIGYLALGLPATLAPQTGERSYFTAWMLSATVKALCLWSLPAAFATTPHQSDPAEADSAEQAPQ